MTAKWGPDQSATLAHRVNKLEDRLDDPGKTNRQPFGNYESLMAVISAMEDSLITAEQATALVLAFATKELQHISDRLEEMVTVVPTPEA
jgi:hypothetical protein